MKKITLTKNKFAIVDDEDFAKLGQFKWYAHLSGGRNFYAARRDRLNKFKFIYMHREIININNSENRIFTDHIDGNGLNNCKENLRICTYQQNQLNKKHPRIDNKLKIKGVCWDKKRKKFRTEIMHNGIRIFLGRFSVLGDADDAYRKAEEKYFGEFARK